MCLCRRRPCCRFIWGRCSFCALHIFPIRLILILFSITDIIIMVWYLSTIEQNRQDITNCCGVSGNNYPNPSIPHHPSLNSNYSTCSDLDYTNLVINSYFDIISPFNKHFFTNIQNYDWNQFKSLFTYYDMDITVASNGGCIYHYNDNQATNCLTNTVWPCVEYVSM